MTSSFLGTITSTTESSRDHVTSAQPQSTAGGGEEEDSQQPLSAISSSADGSIPALLSPPKHLHHLNHLQKVTLRCKASTKRKVTLFFSHLILDPT